eukprot:69059_1
MHRVHHLVSHLRSNPTTADTKSTGVLECPFGSLAESRYMKSHLNPLTIQTVKSTAPLLAERGYEIMRTMYDRMLVEQPEVAELFNKTHQVVLPGDVKAAQPWALACSMHSYASLIDDLDAYKADIERIAQKHVSLCVKPEHYKTVGAYLLWAIKEVLGDAVTPAVANSWEEAYGVLANIFIAREENIREEKSRRPGGWVGWRNFIVDDKIKECDDIYSLYFRAEDESKVPPTFAAGEYIGIRIETPEFVAQRNYTLSMAPGRHRLRITVRRGVPRVNGAPEGVVSCYLHDKVQIGDVVKVSVPCGEFTIKADHDKPIVLISGGVGITPLLAMLEYLLENNVKNSIVMLNASRSPNVEPMHGLLDKYRQKHLNLTVKTLYDDGPDSFPKGPVTMEKLDDAIAHRDCHYYFCGPTGFMKAIYKGLLTQWKIPKEQIHFEFFGPYDDLLL